MSEALPNKPLISPQAQQVAAEPASIALGIPRAKTRIDRINVAVTAASFALLGLAAVVVDPRYQLAWSLTLKQQLTAVGLVLSLQGIGLARLFSKSFPLLEARFGPSTLQNYEAILSNSITTDRASLIWRAVMLVAMAIPLSLSAAYKQFTTGLSSQIVPSHGHRYGPNGPPGLNLGYPTGATLMNNLTTPFMAATSSDANTSQAVGGFPHHYGFNILLLSADSVAFLDTPAPDLVLQMQANLTGTETYQLTAAVNGLVSTRNTTLDGFRHEASFWDNSSLPLMDNPESVLFCQDLYNFNKVCMYAYDLDVEDHTWCMLSVQPARPNASDPDGYEFDSQQFKESAQLFNFTYQECEATWTVTSNSMELQSGSCTDIIIPWSAAPWYGLNAINMAPQNWFMTSLSEMLGLFATERNGSAWELPTMTVAAGGLTYARVSVLVNANGDQGYQLADNIVSQRIVMSNPPALYIVLALQPVLTLIFLGVTYAFYATPLGTGFGLTALLAGVQPNDLTVLRGAAFSGRLRRDVCIRVTLEALEDDPDDYVLQKSARVIYTIDTHPTDGCNRRKLQTCPGQVLF